MSGVLLVLGLIGLVAYALARAVVVDELRGRLHRRIRDDVTATIDSLPRALQEEWRAEWLADVEALRSMPLSALQFARGVRASARELTGAEAAYEWGMARSRAARGSAPWARAGGRVVAVLRSVTLDGVKDAAAVGFGVVVGVLMVGGGINVSVRILLADIGDVPAVVVAILALLLNGGALAWGVHGLVRAVRDHVRER